MKRGSMALMCLCVFLLLTACTSQPSGPQPPEISYGQEMCDQCGMMIDEPRFAAAILLTNGEYRKFDDVGEMLVYQMEHPEDQVSAWFVHDYNSQGWIRGETAFYVRSEELHTPMGMGIAAFADESDAQDFAAQVDGQVYTLDEIRVQVHVEVHG